MMSKIGYLGPVMNGNQEELHGEIKTLQMQLQIKLIPDSFKANDNAPDYIIAAVGYSGADIEIGAAWKKEKQQIGNVLLEFLSITIDDPSLEMPLNVAAFRQVDGRYDITWRRRQKSQSTEDNTKVA